MEVGGNNKTYPGGALSNFTGNRFIFDGVECYSMEGFLQSLKFKNPFMQIEVCKLIGIGAKRKGKNKNWKTHQVLYWKGCEYKRDSKEYQSLLDNAYNAMFEQCEGFRNALFTSKGSVLRHSIGKQKIQDTILTEREFISRLNRLRDQL